MTRLHRGLTGATILVAGVCTALTVILLATRFDNGQPAAINFLIGLMVSCPYLLLGVGSWWVRRSRLASALILTGGILLGGYGALVLCNLLLRQHDSFSAAIAIPFLLLVQFVGCTVVLLSAYLVWWQVGNRGLNGRSSRPPDRRGE